jgi:hypothetical protein
MLPYNIIIDHHLPGEYPKAAIRWIKFCNGLQGIKWIIKRMINLQSTYKHLCKNAIGIKAISAVIPVLILLNNFLKNLLFGAVFFRQLV